MTPDQAYRDYLRARQNITRWGQSPRSRSDGGRTDVTGV